MKALENELKHDPFGVTLKDKELHFQKEKRAAKTVIGKNKTVYLS
jgi:hypothetical protein